MIRTSVGVAGSGFVPDPDKEIPFYRVWGAITLGLAYTYQRQDAIGAGSFLGSS